MKKVLGWKKVRRDTFELAAVDKNDTGLPYNIFLDSVGCNRKNAEPCIYIIECQSIYSIPLKRGYILNCNAEFDYLYDWISDNIEVLILHWYKRLTDKEALKMLKRQLEP